MNNVVDGCLLSVSSICLKFVVRLSSRYLALPCDVTAFLIPHINLRNRLACVPGKSAQRLQSVPGRIVSVSSKVSNLMGDGDPHSRCNGTTEQKT
jgi:hypothetical protein